VKRRLRYLLRLPGRIWRLITQRGVPALFFLASFLRSPRQAVVVWPGDDFRLASRVAIFIHFDRRGAVRADVLNYVSALHALGLSVVFVTNSGRLRPEAMAALQPLCAAVIVRRNVGYDFGAMREAIERAGLPRADTEMVLLVNDSVYGLLQPLGPIMERFDFAQADLWGLTESWQTRYHLQSYFVAFGRPALTSRTWAEFWQSVRPVSSKWWVILHYEVGLTQRFLRVGLRARAVWGYHELVRQVTAPEHVQVMEGEEVDDDGYPVMYDAMLKGRLVQVRHIRAAVSAGLPLNPTSDFWRQLLQTGYPFIKRELLRFNPTIVGDVADWRDVVRECSSADLGAIERDLQRAMYDRTP